MYALGLLLPREITNKAKANRAIVVVGLVLFVALFQVVKILSDYELLSLFLKLICLLGGGNICSGYFRIIGQSIIYEKGF